EALAEDRPPFRERSGTQIRPAVDDNPRRLPTRVGVDDADTEFRSRQVHGDRIRDGRLARRGLLSGGDKRHGLDAADRRLNLGPPFTASQVPKADRPVPARGGKARAVGSDRDPTQAIDISIQTLDALPLAK